jgi:hypothetical protein
MNSPWVSPVANGKHVSYGLVSLWDVINFQISGLCKFLELLWQEERLAANNAHLVKLSGGITSLIGSLPTPTSAFIGDAERKRIDGLLKFALQQCDRMELEAPRHRVEQFQIALRAAMEWNRYEAELRALREAIEGEVQYRYFFYFKRAKAEVVLKMQEAWATTIARFPSAKPDIEAAVNCYGHEENTACVFHLMRVAEYGLRALARERRVKLPKGRPLEWGDWHTVISAIDEKIEKIAGKRRGPARDAALEFYRGALGHFEAFKDKYRNNVMHARKGYDEHEAASALSHVREFTEILASKVESENPKKQIKWGLR